MLLDGHTRWANALGPVVEWLQRDEPVIAILEGEALGLDESTLQNFRNVFCVKKFS